MFRKNFLKEWRLLMTPEEQGIIVDLDCCDFRQIKKHLVEQARRRKERYNLVLELCDGKLLDLTSVKSLPNPTRSKEEENPGADPDGHDICTIDGREEKVVGFR